MIFNLRKEDEFIKLGQLMKACNMVSSGSEAKSVIKDGYVSVNDIKCDMRGKKIYRGDKVKYNKEEVIII